MPYHDPLKENFYDPEKDYRNKPVYKQEDTNMFGKDEFLKELEALKSRCDDITDHEDLEGIEQELNRLDEQYDFAFWAGRGGIGDDENIFPLIDAISLRALSVSEKNHIDIEIQGHNTIGEYLDQMKDCDLYDDWDLDYINLDNLEQFIGEILTWQVCR